MTRTPRLRSLRCLGLAALLLLPAPSRAEPTPVTLWTDQADALGNGNSNWHSLAVMHMAVHDAVQAIAGTHARWAPPDPDEPDAAGALPEAAAETAAASVLLALHPSRRGEVAAILQNRLDAMPAGPARDRGWALGAAVARATLARRAGDGFTDVHLFPAAAAPGAWRPTPPRHVSSATTRTRPFLFPRRDSLPFLPPPEPGSARYLDDVEVARRLGGEISLARTPQQTEAAVFWAYQSTQRGFVHLAATLLDAEPNRLPLAEQARTMSQLTAAMADTAILVWAAKERWNYWRPVDAIRSGQFGVPADPAWTSFIETPQHPEYPSGHAADCQTGAALLRALLERRGPVTYVAQSAPSVAPEEAVRPATVWSSDMGSPPPPSSFRATPRGFPRLEDAARECADARVWAGAHFPAANEESRRMADLIVARALAALPPLTR